MVVVKQKPRSIRYALLVPAFLVPISVLLPFAPNLSVMLLLEVIAGLTSGSFYPLALSFILRNLPVRYSIFALAISNSATQCPVRLPSNLNVMWPGASCAEILSIALLPVVIPRGNRIATVQAPYGWARKWSSVSR